MLYRVYIGIPFPHPLRSTSNSRNPEQAYSNYGALFRLLHLLAHFRGAKVLTLQPRTYKSLSHKPHNVDVQTFWEPGGLNTEQPWDLL